jgi:hypothetical protein
MNHYARKLKTLSNRNAYQYRILPAYLHPGSIKAFLELCGKTIQCTAGNLWVTIEGDMTDYVLRSGECLVVLSDGKVILSGPGHYFISLPIEEEFALPLAATGS